MKFSLAFLSALPLTTFAAPIIGTLTQSGADSHVLDKQLNANLAPEMMGSLQAQVQPLLKHLSFVMEILPVGSDLDSLSLDDLSLESLNKMHVLNLLDLNSVQESVEKDMNDVLSTMTGAINNISTLQGVCPNTEEVSQLMHDILADMTGIVGEAQQIVGNEKIVQQATQMTGAVSQLVTVLSGMVQNFVPALEKQISGMTGSLPSQTMSLLQGLHHY